jgi:hypothetical protein
MQVHMVKRQPNREEEELLRKREKLTEMRADLAERELELVDLRRELRAFASGYLRGLDAQPRGWTPPIASPHTAHDPSEEGQEQLRNPFGQFVTRVCPDYLKHSGRWVLQMSSLGSPIESSRFLQ